MKFTHDRSSNERCSDLTERQDTKIVVLVMATKVTYCTTGLLQDIQLLWIYNGAKSFDLTLQNANPQCKFLA